MKSIAKLVASSQRVLEAIFMEPFLQGRCESFAEPVLDLVENDRGQLDALLGGLDGYALDFPVCTTEAAAGRHEAVVVLVEETLKRVPLSETTSRQRVTRRESQKSQMNLRKLVTKTESKNQHQAILAVAEIVSQQSDRVGGIANTNLKRSWPKRKFCNRGIEKPASGTSSHCGNCATM